MALPAELLPVGHLEPTSPPNWDDQGLLAKIEGHVDALARDDEPALRRLHAALLEYKDGRLRKALEVYIVATYLRYETLRRHSNGHGTYCDTGADLKLKVLKAERLARGAIELKLGRADVVPPTAKGLLLLYAHDRCATQHGKEVKTPGALLTAWLAVHEDLPGRLSSVMRGGGWRDAAPGELFFADSREGISPQVLLEAFPHGLRGWFLYLDRLALPPLLAPAPEARLLDVERALADAAPGGEKLDEALGAAETARAEVQALRAELAATREEHQRALAAIQEDLKAQAPRSPEPPGPSPEPSSDEGEAADAAGGGDPEGGVVPPAPKRPKTRAAGEAHRRRLRAIASGLQHLREPRAEVAAFASYNVDHYQAGPSPECCSSTPWRLPVTLSPVAAPPGVHPAARPRRRGGAGGLEQGGRPRGAARPGGGGGLGPALLRAARGPGAGAARGGGGRPEPPAPGGRELGPRRGRDGMRPRSHPWMKSRTRRKRGQRRPHTKKINSTRAPSGKKRARASVCCYTGHGLLLAWMTGCVLLQDCVACCLSGHGEPRCR
jgi:hypothetical protein